MNSKSVSIPKVRMTGAVVAIASPLVYSSMDVAIQNGNCHVGAVVYRVTWGHTASIVHKAMESNSGKLYLTKLNALLLFIGNMEPKVAQRCWGLKSDPQILSLVSCSLNLSLAIHRFMRSGGK